MTQIVFLDTNVMLDFLERRHKEVESIIHILLRFHRRGKLILATSIFNIAELLDKEVDIYFFGKLLIERLSYDEIVKRRNDSKMRREIAVRHKEDVKKKVEEFIFENNIRVFSQFSGESATLYRDLYELILVCGLSSQDALIVSTALSNDCTYFLSNDSKIVKILNEKGLIDAYNLRNEHQRKEFENNVLESLMEVLE